MIYETSHGIATGLPFGESFLGIIGAAVVVQRLRTVSMTPNAWWKGPLSLIYLTAILALFFFTYAAGINALHTG